MYEEVREEFCGVISLPLLCGCQGFERRTIRLSLQAPLPAGSHGAQAHCEAEDDLRLLILLPLPCCDSWGTPPHPVYTVLGT